MAKRPRSDSTVAPGRLTKKTKVQAGLCSRPTQVLDVFVCGDGELGDLGLGFRRRNGLKPVEVKAPRLNHLLDAQTAGVVQIAAGGVHAAALTKDSKILTWGVNDDGALGRDTKRQNSSSEEDEEEDDEFGLDPNESTPAAISADDFGIDATSIVQVVASDSATFALTSHGSVYGWGIFHDNNGKWAFSVDDPVAKEGQPRPKLIPQLKNIIALAAGSNHVLALNKTGVVYAWGCGQQDQLGVKSYPKHAAGSEKESLKSLIPSPVFLPGQKIKAIACGLYHSFAIDGKGRVYAWGSNNYSQTGVPHRPGLDQLSIDLPTLVVGLTSYRIEDIAGGNHHSIARSSDGTVLVWGRCDHGQMGLALDRLPQETISMAERGYPETLLVPTEVPNLQAICIDAGIDNSVAITSDGKAYAWGYSENYRTGLGTTDDVMLPTLINNTAVSKARLTKAACGGQFLLLAGPSRLSNGA